MFGSLIYGWLNSVFVEIMYMVGQVVVDLGVDDFNFYFLSFRQPSAGIKDDGAKRKSMR